ncbi:HAD-IA family hydrolase [Nioella nitratireducens]|uniref:HAD-IA family hydrolase n=1 Tax=Nioella nitratireducens TaxID=1287720 RepID=UPI0008FD6A2B|nr:HAD-IA family hydrolase [Nioella nitratireducens]
MTGPLRLVIFDVDGTLIDSQAHILAAMAAAFEGEGMLPPTREETLAIVGLSLPIGVARLAPEADDLLQGRLVEGYKDAFARLRVENGAGLSPLYPGARAALDWLAGQDEVLLGIATGKSRRGMNHLIEMHGLSRLFQTVQVADDHPSKPHPSMIEACLRETGVDAEHAVILGDTVFDMEMGRSAGIPTLGVTWGYHPAEHLAEAGARVVLSDFADLAPTLQAMWGEQ